jgi:hypothetical protein
MKKLTPLLQQQICTYIRAGAFPHIAAEASGVSADDFALWLSKGLSTKKGKYHSFACEVRKASAQARIAAEMQVWEQDPEKWLKHGPGKDKEGSEGWGQPPIPRVTEKNQQINVLLHPQMQGLFAALLQLLAPYPEARAAVAQALAGDLQKIG